MTKQAGHEPNSRSRAETRSHLRAVLVQAERLTRSGAVLDTDTRDALRSAAIAAAPLSRAFSRRLSGVMSTDALRTREEPHDELRGLTDDVMRIADGERFARARMSGTYLDVPDSLRFWRRVAFGATCVLVLGVLWNTQTSPREAVTRGHGNSALEPLDPRNQLRLLTPFEARDASARGSSARGSSARGSSARGSSAGSDSARSNPAREVGSSTMTPTGAGAPYDMRLPERFGRDPAGKGTAGLELLMESGGSVFFIDPSGRARLRVGFGAPRPAPPSTPELPERN